MRNTYDNKHPLGKLPGASNQEKDFDTYSNQVKMSYQKQPPTTSNTASNNQKMTKSILETLKKIYQDNEKVISSAGFKPNQKTLLSTIAALLHSFDNLFQQSNLSLQILPQLFKALGYPNTVNKTYFQPVGAPHTWGQCLTMMDWLSDLASFHMDIRNQLQEGDFQSDLTSLLIKSHLQQDKSIIKNYLENEIDRKSKAIQNYRYTISTLNLEIENQKAAQKQLNELDQQQKRIQAILHRQTQEVIQINQQNFQWQRKIKEQDARIQEQKRIQHMLDRQIESLNNQILNQQLSVEQVERIRFQIKEYREKITELKKFQEREKNSLDAADEIIIEQYMDFSKTLQILKHMYKKHKYEMDKRNIYLHIPECSVSTFTELLKDRKEDCTEFKIQQTIGTKEIREINQKANILLNMVESELTNLDESKEQFSIQNQQLNEACIDKDIHISQQSLKLLALRTKQEGISHQIQDSKQRNKHLTIQVNLMEEEKRKLEQINKQSAEKSHYLLKQTQQFKKTAKLLEKQIQQNLQKMYQDLQKFKSQSLQDLERDYEQVAEFTQQILEFGKSYEDQENQDFWESKPNQQNNSNQIEVDGVPNSNLQISQKNDNNIEMPRCNLQKNAGNQFEYDYTKIFGTGLYQSPKADRIDRLKRL